MPSSTLLKFSLKIGALPEETFRIHEFTLEEAVSECFQLHIEAASEEGDIAYADLIGQPAAVTVAGEEFDVTHFGRVTAFDYAPMASDNFGSSAFLYTLTVEPALKQLAYFSHNRIFQNQDVLEIVSDVLRQSGFHPHDFRLEAQGPFPKRPFTVQYNETDLDFLQRLLEEEGIYYFFDHGGSSESLVMANKPASIIPVPHTPTLPYHSEAGLSHLQKDHVMRIRRYQKAVSGKVFIEDYNPSIPEVNVLGIAGGSDPGELHLFSPHAKNPDDANRMAQIKMEMLACDKNVLEGEGICRTFRPGYRFRLEAAGPGFDGEYMLIRVTHKGNQREGFEGDQASLNYSNHFTCIPAGVPYRPHLRTAKPKIHGVITARVDGRSGSYAYLDEEGRYRAKLPFDASDLKDGLATQPIPMTQPYAGPNYGMHFPLHNGNDLVLAFIDGDVDRPVALGALPNPSNLSPVTSRNKSESLVRTASGHQIRMDDSEDKTVLDITTHGGHLFSMNDEEKHREIRLRSSGKNEIILDDHDRNILLRTTDGGHLIKLDNQNTILTIETKYGHKLTMDDASKSIGLQTKNGHMLKLDDQGDLLTLSDGKNHHTFQIDAQGGAISITTQGDMRIKAKGAFQVEAAEIQMEATQGALNLKSAQDTNVHGMNVNAKADMDLKLEGGVGASLKGLNTAVEAEMNLDVKAGAMNQVTGAMMNVEATGINTIKGAMVMIN